MTGDDDDDGNDESDRSNGDDDGQDNGDEPTDIYVNSNRILMVSSHIATPCCFWMIVVIIW